MMDTGSSPHSENRYCSSEAPDVGPSTCDDAEASPCIHQVHTGLQLDAAFTTNKGQGFSFNTILKFLVLPTP